jgi:hypothetical protein
MTTTWKVTPFHEGGFVLVRRTDDSVQTLRLTTPDEAADALRALQEHVVWQAHREDVADGKL